MLSVLGQRTPRGLRVSGSIYVNGERVTPHDSTMAVVSGFLYQQDLFMGSLTVKEHLTFVVSARG
jgi:ABC-type multidrug transport system ATPase subunit